MTATMTALVPLQPAFSDAERLAPRISRAPPGSPHRLPAPPGGDGGPAELAHRPIPAAEPDGRGGY
jgi:hypothetical protein